jgi:general secretion pathway protein H
LKIFARSSGFSLLEMLVVVFIIGILVTMATLSIGTTGGDRELDQELERLQALIDLAGEEALMQGREIGLRFYPDHYEFSTESWETTEVEEVTTTVAKWRLLQGDEMLKTRNFATDIVIELMIDDRNVVLKNEPKKKNQKSNSESENESESEDEDNDYEPQIFIYSSGDISPFSIRMRRRFNNEGLTLTVEGDGSSELVRDER